MGLDFLVPNFGNDLNSFLETAMVIGQLDLVISIDTAVVHLGGAMGKTTFLPLPYNPEWRWMYDRTDSPWYESVQIYRQKEPNNWKNVVNNMKENIKYMLSD